MLSDPVFISSVTVTSHFLLLAISLEFLIGLGLAFLFNQKFKGFNFLKLLILPSMIISPIVSGIIWRMLYAPELGVLSYYISLLGMEPPIWLGDPSVAIYSIVILDVWQWTPFIFLIMSASLMSLPKEPLEAAKLDGAGRVRMLISHYLPMMKPAIFIAITLRLIDAAKIFDQIYIMTRGGPALSTEMISFLIFRTGFQNYNMGYASALSFAFLIALTILTLAFIKGAKIKV